MKNDLVSIIIPYFRKKEFFTQTIKSVEKQTYKNKEIFVIYDDYDQSDLNFIKRIIKKKNYHLIVNKFNIGAGRSRNKGILKSKGKYIAFLDSDDLWSKNKLKKQINFMNKKKISASFTAYNIINEKNEKISSRAADKKIFFENLLFSCNIGLSTVILKKNILKGNNKFPDLKTKEDYVLWLLLAKKKIVFHGINKKLSCWRKTSNSLSSDIIQKLLDGFKVYNKYMKFNVLKSIKHLFLLSFNYFKKLNFF